MKTIHQIKEEKQKRYNDLMTACHVFFAFNEQQFEEGKKKHPLAEGDKYVRIFGGGLMPKSQVEAFQKGITEIENWYKGELKSNKARKANIAFELANHEAFYVNDITDTLEALGPDYTRAEVMEVYLKERKKRLKADKI